MVKTEEDEEDKGVQETEWLYTDVAEAERDRGAPSRRGSEWGCPWSMDTEEPSPVDPCYAGCGRTASDAEYIPVE